MTADPKKGSTTTTGAVSSIVPEEDSGPHRSMREEFSTRGRKSAAVGVCANLLLSLIKGLAGFYGHSHALIADAVESLGDVLNSAVVWIGLRVAVKPADVNHPYGHGKAEPMAAAAVSLALVGAAVAIAIQSVYHIAAPGSVPQSFTLWILLGAVVVKEGLFRFVASIGQDIGSTAVKSDAWHHRADAITSLVAFFGISIARYGGPGYEAADGWAALFASFVIGVNAIKLLQPAVNELADTAPPPEIAHGVRESAAKVNGVVEVEKCFVRKMGFDYFVDLHIMVDGAIPVRTGHAIAHNVQDAVKAADARIAAVLVHVEPAQTA